MIIVDDNSSYPFDPVFTFGPRVQGVEWRETGQHFTSLIIVYAKEKMSKARMIGKYNVGLVERCSSCLRRVSAMIIRGLFQNSSHCLINCYAHH